MIHGGLQVLAQGQHLTSVLQQIVHGFQYLLLGLSKSQHHARFGYHFRLCYLMDHRKAPVVSGPGSDLGSESLHGFQVMGDHLRCCINYQLNQRGDCIKIGNQGLHGQTGQLLFQDPDGPGPEPCPLIGQIIPVHRCNDRMGNPHGPDGSGQTKWFLLIYREGFACFHRTKFTGAGAYLTQDHKGGRSGCPALPYIGTISTGANGMQLMLTNLLLYLHITVTSRHLHSHPVR